MLALILNLFGGRRQARCNAALRSNFTVFVRRFCHDCFAPAFGVGEIGGGDSWVIGMVTTGFFGWDVFIVNSSCWPGGTSNFSGNSRFSRKSLPGCDSVMSILTPLALIEISESLVGVLPFTRTFTAVL